MMAVIPGSSDIPAGAYSAAGLQSLQDVTEQSVKDSVRAQVMPSVNRAKDSLFGNLLNGVFGGFLDVIRGGIPPLWLPSNAYAAAAQIRDGQQDLNDRADLLSPLMDYCSAFAPPDNNGHARFGIGLIPFTSQIGPARNVRIRDDGRFELLDKGLWDIRAHVVPSWTGVTVPNISVSIRVYSPYGDTYETASRLFSEQTSIEKTSNVTSFSLVSSVVVDKPGYIAGVYVDDANNGRGILGGPRFSRFTVQHISRDVVNKTGGEDSTPTPTTTGPE
ncbi:hypothetical protein [Corynebacterium heidelbergense]|uniref:Uncharacterized protein n=1 Tax=Corynebacterium heidelbergense TaxID=2055947 RepID=A0A364VE60_9CORY|nr:hypothetical protein [Corynebacterium heidelbergense]RAV34930.1 hypothetical protein CWC39_00910 [Corynebacterium heidelbergense]WCZ36069.1 hypothetical protein CHEID_02515 [Corynebacterium heidelbergense]